MKRISAAVFILLWLANAALAQQVSMPPPAGTQAILCAYNASLPTVATGKVGYVQCDVNGQLLISGGGGGGTVTQGPQGTNAAGWWTWIGDGTNGPVAVKPASTAPSAADKSFVVAISPNNCPLHGFVHITSATDTLAVQGVTDQAVLLCAWKARAAGVATWYWENTASTNANCSSAKVQISGVATEAANTGEVVSLPPGTYLPNTSGNGLCINSTGTGGVDIDYWYGQR